MKNKEFQNSSQSFLTKWDDCHIPTIHHYYLIPKQIKLLQKIFKKPYILKYSYKLYDNDKGEINYFYALDSEKDYSLFLTLPIELRSCLTKTPKSEIKITSVERLGFGNCVAQINTGQTIEMPTFGTLRIGPAQTILVQTIPYISSWTKKSIMPETKLLSLK